MVDIWINGCPVPDPFGISVAWEEPDLVWFWPKSQEVKLRTRRLVVWLTRREQQTEEYREVRRLHPNDRIKVVNPPVVYEIENGKVKVIDQFA